MSIKVIFGLGNTGAAYAGTRHNAGAMFLVRLANAYGGHFAKNKYCAAFVAKVKICSADIVLAFCDGYMNNSGEGVAKTLSFLKVRPADAAVIYDDITLDAGRLKLSQGGSSGGHNGVASVMDRIGNDFVRIRVGIGAKPLKEMPLADYVLGKVPDGDWIEMKKIDICAVAEAIVRDGLAKAQNLYNRC